MEIFGIALSVPVAFIISSVYCLLLVKVLVPRFRKLAAFLRISSWLVLALFTVEIGFLLTFGSVRSRELIGPAFYGIHFILFVLGTPALANVIILRSKGFASARWYLTPVLCTAFSLGLVLLQYGVSEALYGINGDDGPYSRHGASSSSATEASPKSAGRP